MFAAHPSLSQPCEICTSSTWAAGEVDIVGICGFLGGYKWIEHDIS